jgi:MraZ protein
MLLTGTHPRSLDDKNRLALPKRIRDAFGEQVTQIFLAPGPDQCLWLFDQDSLEKLAHKLDQAPAADGGARVFRRLFFAQMEAADLDKAGRIVVPPRLAQLAGLGREVVLLGVRDHLELWDAAKWQEYLGEHGPQFDKVAENAFVRD